MKAYDVEVGVSTSGDILIKQSDGESHEGQTIIIHPDQIGMVCKWLMAFEPTKPSPEADHKCPT
jgi:hypothetical protein